MSFASLARATRQKNRVYLREIATALGISVAYVSEVERGTRPVPIQHARKWAEASGGDPDEFEQQALADRFVLSLRLAPLNQQQRELAYRFTKALPQCGPSRCAAIATLLELPE